MEIHSYGIMRGGIHIVHSWIISKFDDDSVLYYNNIRDPNNLEDRLITKQDTRTLAISNKLTTSGGNVQLILKSFESKSLTICKNSHKNVINILVIRNPYNNLASSIAYCENNGVCSDVKSDNTFIELWKDCVQEALGITEHFSNKVVIVYDVFISDQEYRHRKAAELGIRLFPDTLNTLYMGGGSSFKTTDTNYLERYLEYKNHPTMVKLIANPVVSKYWEEIKKK